MTQRQALAWSIAALVAAADMPACIAAVELMRNAAQLIARTGALPHRCDNAATLFRRMIAEEAAGSPLVTDEMQQSYRAELERVAARRRGRGAA